MEYLNLLLAVFLSMLSMFNERYISFLSIILVLFMYTIPIGYSVLTASALFGGSKKTITFFEKIILSLGIGLVFLAAINLFSTFIKFDFKIIIVLELLIILICMLLRRKINYSGADERLNCCINVQNKIKSVSIKSFLILLLAMYYFIVPLTTDYADFRDYPLLALGFEEYSSSFLPLYHIGIYYPPGSSLITGLIHEVLPNINPNYIMISLSHFFVFMTVLLFYILGKIVFDKKVLGFFLAASFLIGSASKNFVTGGATAPAIMATVSGIITVIILINYLRLKSEYTQYQKNCAILLFGLSLGATAIYHFDTLLTFLWGISAIVLTQLIFRKKQLFLQIFNFILLGSIISLFVAAPFLLRSLNFKSELEKTWTLESWEDYSKGEIHPKSISEVMFFVGDVLFILGLMGIILFIIKLTRDWLTGKNYNYDDTWLFLCSASFWIIFIWISNSFFFLKLVKPIFLFYAINIVLWHGITLPLTFSSGFLLYLVYNHFFSKRSKRSKLIFIVLTLLLTLALITDYETFNYQKTFTRQGGFFMLPFADRAGYISQGDMNTFRTLSKLPRGNVLNYPSVSGRETIIFSSQPTYIYFTHNFYDNLTQNNWMIEREKKALDFFKNLNDSLILLENISYIFIPSEISAIDDYNPLILTKYDLIYRFGGAKLLSPKKTSE